jgi:hypothetical protein
MKSTMGLNLGTAVGGRWQRRALSRGVLARGNRGLGPDGPGIWCHKHLTPDPIVIPRLLVEDLEAGR